MLYFSRWKTVLIWAVVLAGVILALPNVFTQDQLVNCQIGCRRSSWRWAWIWRAVRA